MHPPISRRMEGIPPSFIRSILKVATQPGIISFAGGLPNPALFPVSALQDASEKVLMGDGRIAMQYHTTAGHEGLREWIANRYRLRFGLQIPVESILITNGSQQALDLLGKVLLDPGDGVIIEEPGYLGAIQAFSLYQPRFHTVLLSENGLDLERLERILGQETPKLCYTVPNFQNPTGVSYSASHREQIAQQIGRHPMLIIEDDPYGELRFSGSDAPSFMQLLPQQTILLGSFSKTIAPSLRIGWIVAPSWLMEKLLIAKQAADLHSSGFAQRILHHYLCHNDYDTHLGHLIENYSRHYQTMAKAIDRHFPEQVHCTQPNGGMFIWATLPMQMSASSLFDAALARQVAFVPGHPFYLHRQDSHTLRLNFTGADEAAIATGIERLGEAIRKELPLVP